MMRGVFWPIVAGAALCLAGCAPRRPTGATVQRCVERADAERRACFQDCEGDFEEMFVACYGRDACTERCQTQQIACQASPLHDLDFCAEAVENPLSCEARLRSERQGCAGRSDRAACEEDAQHRATGCWQACQRAHGPALEQCAQAFKTCLDGCAAR